MAWKWDGRSHQGNRRVDFSIIKLLYTSLWGLIAYSVKVYIPHNNQESTFPTFTVPTHACIFIGICMHRTAAFVCMLIHTNIFSKLPHSTHASRTEKSQDRKQPVGQIVCHILLNGSCASPRGLCHIGPLLFSLCLSRWTFFPILFVLYLRGTRGSSMHLLHSCTPHPRLSYFLYHVALEGYSAITPTHPHPHYSGTFKKNPPYN